MRLPHLNELLVYAETDEGTIEWTYLHPVGQQDFFRMSILFNVNGVEYLRWQDISPVIVASAKDPQSVFSYVADRLREHVRMEGGESK